MGLGGERDCIWCYWVESLLQFLGGKTAVLVRRARLGSALWVCYVEAQMKVL